MFQVRPETYPRFINMPGFLAWQRYHTKIGELRTEKKDFEENKMGL